MSDMQFTKHSVTISMSSEALEFYSGSLPPLSPAKEAEYATRKESARLRKGEFKVALRDAKDPLLRELIEHHAQDTEYGWSKCRGCDQGCSCDSPEWPCSTVMIIAASLGVDTTDMDGLPDMADWRSEV